MKANFMPVVYGTQSDVAAGLLDNMPGVTIIVVDGSGSPTGVQLMGQASGSPTVSGITTQFRGTVSSSTFPTTGGTGTGGALAPGDYFTFNGNITFTATSSNKINGATSGTFPGFGGDELLVLSNTSGVINWDIIAREVGYTPASSGVNSDITSLSGLTTPLSEDQGGTGADNISDARTNLDVYSTSEVDAAIASIPTLPSGTADQVLRIPHVGGSASFGQIDLSQSPSVTGVLPPENQWSPTISVSSNTVLTAKQITVLCDTTLASFNVTLPAPSDRLNIRVKKTVGGTNKVSVFPASGLIDGAAKKDVGGNRESFTFMSDGTNYFIV